MSQPSRATMATPTRYVDLKVPALREKCAEAGLDSTGLRRDLIARLERKDRMAEAREREVRQRERERFRGSRASLGGGYQGSAFRGAAREVEERGRRVTFGDAETGPGFPPAARDGRERSPPTDRAQPRVLDYDGLRSDPRYNHNRISALAPASAVHQNLPVRPSLEPDLIWHPHQNLDLAMLDKTEEELEQILYANWTPFQHGPSDFQRRTTIRAEHDVTLDEARKKKDTAVARAIAKYNAEVEKLRIERDGKMQVVERLVVISFFAYSLITFGMTLTSSCLECQIGGIANADLIFTVTLVPEERSVGCGIRLLLD